MKENNFLKELVKQIDIIGLEKEVDGINYFLIPVSYWEDIKIRLID